MRCFRLLTLAVAAALPTGCADLLAPSEQLPDGAYRIEPAPDFPALWAKVESCSGKSARFDKLTWYVVAGSPFGWVDREHGAVSALYHRAHQRILLSEYVVNRTGGAEYRAETIMHEMLHAHISDRGHPTAYFGEPWRPDSSAAPGLCGLLLGRNNR